MTNGLAQSQNIIRLIHESFGLFHVFFGVDPSISTHGMLISIT
jgi:hypothetical protein